MLDRPGWSRAHERRHNDLLRLRNANAAYKRKRSVFCCSNDTHTALVEAAVAV
jgi:hypothetical protein